MKLVKSLFLGSAAGLAVAVGAQAADLPVAKAAAVEYVRVCSTYGAGFFYIPGTETCLRVGGRVRAEYSYLEPRSREDDSIGFLARGRVQLDARTATAYGLLRAFVRMEMSRESGVYGGPPTGLNSDPNIAQAYIQFGGLTAGRTTSFFTNGDVANENFGTLRFYDYPDVNLLAYTFSFGNGFSATLSLEEGSFATTDLANVAGVNAGQRLPDLVGNVKYSGTWGSAQLSGALHQIRSNALVGGEYADSELGWAVSGMVNVNLPMLAEGDALWLAATYADGALGYLGFDPDISVGIASGTVLDAYLGPDGEIETGRGWSLAGGLNHYWTPTIRQSLFGSYARVEYGTVAPSADFTEWRVGSNLIWSPVSGLDIGVEALYSNLNPRGIVGADDDDAWEGRLRIQRDF
jgi:hypothetical protein